MAKTNTSIEENLGYYSLSMGFVYFFLGIVKWLII